MGVYMVKIKASHPKFKVYPQKTRANLRKRRKHNGRGGKEDRKSYPRKGRRQGASFNAKRTRRTAGRGLIRKTGRGKNFLRHQHLPFLLLPRRVKRHRCSSAGRRGKGGGLFPANLLLLWRGLASIPGKPHVESKRNERGG